MLSAAGTPSMFAVAVWLCANQTHIDMVNSSNRNATLPTPYEALVTGYVGALVSGVGVALGLTQSIKVLPGITARTQGILTRFVPYPAVAGANVCNLYMMRRQELQTGIEVKAEDGTCLGLSQHAATHALAKTAITRLVLPIPTLVLPPIIMLGLEKHFAPLRTTPRLMIPTQIAIASLSFVFGLPLSLSVFPQYSELDVKHLEPRFHDCVDGSGQPVARVLFNRGL